MKDFDLVVNVYHNMPVVDVEADQGGGVHGRPHVLRYNIDFRSSMLCITIGDWV